MSDLDNELSEERLSDCFNTFSQKFYSMLASGEHARISLAAEQTQFTRFSRGRVRQSGQVEDATLTVRMISARQSTAELVIPFVVHSDEWMELARRVLEQVRRQCEDAPHDPFVHLPSQKMTSCVSHRGVLPREGEVVDALLGQARPEDDLVGIYAGGQSISALSDSAGTQHWFSSESFFVDYSLWLENGRAVKSGYAGREWNQNDYARTLERARTQLTVLKNPVKILKPGPYRVFLAPSATSELLGMFSWGALSEGALQRNDSPLCAVRRGEKSFSPLFSLQENYQLGCSPRFSGEGELSAEVVPLFEKGRFVQALCSSRTAKEYGVAGNGSASETLRTPDMGVGDLATGDCLSQLGTGLYLSDLHYLNWSDMNQGRVTGMTRYGCMWVEDGVPVGPIQDMRFDETIFRCFGSELLAVTRESEIIPETSTYGRRALGGVRVPGVLLRQFNFTL